MIDEKLLPYIVAGLSIHNGPIRSAACKCIKSLSRSVKNLRTSLTDAGIAKPLYKLLFDTNVEVLVMASAAICNIILDFSPIKKSIIDMGGIVRLVELLNSDNQSLQLNAVWGLKNLTFKADIDAKLGVMAKLRWKDFCHCYITTTWLYKNMRFVLCGTWLAVATRYALTSLRTLILFLTDSDQ